MTVPLPIQILRWLAIVLLLGFTLLPIYWILITGFRRTPRCCRRC